VEDKKEVLDQLYDHYLQKWTLKNLITFVIRHQHPNNDWKK